MDLNVKAPFFLTQALHASLRAAATKDRPAKVINIASIDGIYLTPQETYSYVASKSGLIQLTRLLAAKLIGDGIVVTAIAPGAFKSDMNILARDHEDQVAARVPAKRIGRDEDMAGAAIFLSAQPQIAIFSWIAPNIARGILTLRFPVPRLRVIRTRPCRSRICRSCWTFFRSLPTILASS